MTEAATCCAECVAMQLETDCEPCSTTPHAPEPEFRYQVLLEDSPAMAITTTPTALKILLVTLNAGGRRWHAQPL